MDFLIYCPMRTSPQPIFRFWSKHMEGDLIAEASMCSQYSTLPRVGLTVLWSMERLKFVPSLRAFSSVRQFCLGTLTLNIWCLVLAANFSWLCTYRRGSQKLMRFNT